jgi:hypothetical protein
MKSFTAVLLVLFLSVVMWAQAVPQEPAPPPEHPMKHEPAQDHMMAMPQNQMVEAKAELEKMKATLEKMKANLAQVKRPGLLRTQEELNIEMWEIMIGHMDEMLKMMDKHSGHMDMRNAPKAPPMPEAPPQPKN